MYTYQMCVEYRYARTSIAGRWAKGSFDCRGDALPGPSIPSAVAPPRTARLVEYTRAQLGLPAAVADELRALDSKIRAAPTRLMAMFAIADLSCMSRTLSLEGCLIDCLSLPSKVSYTTYGCASLLTPIRCPSH